MYWTCSPTCSVLTWWCRQVSWRVYLAVLKCTVLQCTGLYWLAQCSHLVVQTGVRVMQLLYLAVLNCTTMYLLQCTQLHWLVECSHLVAQRGVKVKQLLYMSVLYCIALYLPVLTCTMFSPGDADRCQDETSAVFSCTWVYCTVVYWTCPPTCSVLTLWCRQV